MACTNSIFDTRRPRPDTAAKLHIAQTCASTMIRLFNPGKHLPPSEILALWNDMASWIEQVVTASKLDPAVCFASITLLQQYKRLTKRAVDQDEAYYRIFIAAFMIAAKIICPRHRVGWTSIGGDRLVGESVALLERQFLIDIYWDQRMMEIINEVWDAYSEAAQEYDLKGEEKYKDNRLSKSSSTTSFDPSSSGRGSSLSQLFPTPLLLTPLKPDVNRRLSPPNSPSALRQTFLPNTTGEERSSSALDSNPLESAKSDTLEVTAPSRTLRNRLSRIFSKK